MKDAAPGALLPSQTRWRNAPAMSLSSKLRFQATAPVYVLGMVDELVKQQQRHRKSTIVIEQYPSTGLLQKIKDTFEGRLVTEARSQAGNWLGFTLEKAERGHVEFSLPVRREMTNPFGGLHGGMMGVIVDECMGWAVVTLDLPVRYTTTGLHLDFLRAAREGETVRSVAEVVREGKRTIYVECSVFGGDGKLAARANSTLISLG